jgi:hypothetical protein
VNFFAGHKISVPVINLNGLVKFCFQVHFNPTCDRIVKPNVAPRGNIKIAAQHTINLPQHIQVERRRHP